MQILQIQKILRTLQKMIKMDKRKISLILLTIFAITIAATAINTFMSDSANEISENGTLTIKDSKTNLNRSVNYEAKGECLKVIDGDTIWVYGVGKVRLVQIDTPEKGESGFDEAKKFVEDRCLGKTVYLDIDDEEPYDKYDRTLAIVYTDSEDINRELLNNNLAETLYIPPSEFKKGEI